MSKLVLVVVVFLFGLAADAAQTSNSRLTKSSGASYSNQAAFQADTGSASASVGSPSSVSLTTNGYDLSSIPAGSTINGIRVQTYSGLSASGGCDWFANVQLMKSGSATGASKSVSLSGTGVAVSIGGFSDLWSTTWTTAELQAAGFGVIYNFFTPQEDCGSATNSVRHIYVAIDYTAPVGPAVQSLSPADNATKVRPESNLVITFDMTVDTQTGNLTIKRSSDDSTLQTIAINSGSVTGNGTSALTINPPSNMPATTGLYINIDTNAITNTSGAGYAGISNGNTWNFTTGQQTSNYWSTP
jgi:hypothetical protein